MIDFITSTYLSVSNMVGGDQHMNLFDFSVVMCGWTGFTIFTLWAVFRPLNLPNSK